MTSNTAVKKPYLRFREIFRFAQYDNLYRGKKTLSSFPRDLSLIAQGDRLYYTVILNVVKNPRGSGKLRLLFASRPR